VPDEYQVGLGTETAISVAELCAVSMWERIDGGHRVLDWGAVEVHLERVREPREQDGRARAWEPDRSRPHGETGSGSAAVPSVRNVVSLIEVIVPGTNLYQHDQASAM